MNSDRETRLAEQRSSPDHASVLSRVIIDNSVWQRAHLPRVAESIRELIHAGVEIVTCAPQLLEVLWSARNGAEHAKLLQTFGTYRSVDPMAGFTTESARLHGLLWTNGRVRAVGNSDVQIAVIALQNQCTVIHYDSDFEFVKAVEPRFSHRWIAPRGSLPH